MTRHALSTLLFAALLFSAPSIADEAAPGVARIDPKAFSQVKTLIEQELEGNERYKEISAEDRDRVLDALDRMTETLAGVSSVHELDTDQRTALINDQNLVNTVLTQAAEDSRLICSREQKVGTRFKTTVCETVAQRRERNEAAQRALSSRNRSTMQPLPGG